MSDSNGFEIGDEVFCAFHDEKDLYRDGWFYLCEYGGSVVILKTKSGNVLMIPLTRILKMKKKVGHE